MKSINVAELIRRGNGRYNVGGSLYLVVRGGSALWEYQFRQNKRLHSVGLGSARSGLDRARRRRASRAHRSRRAVLRAMPPDL
jgi:hypothetical protein